MIDPYVLPLARLEDFVFVRSDGQHHQQQARELVHVGDELHGVRGVVYEGVGAHCSAEYFTLYSSSQKSSIFCFAQLFLQILVKF